MSLTANNGDAVNQFDADELGFDYDRMDGPLSNDPESLTGSGDVNSSYFSDYVGTGTFAVNYSSLQYQHWSGASGNSTSSSPISSRGYVTITYTYDYTPVPEPTTFALIGAGGLAIVLRRRFRKV